MTIRSRLINRLLKLPPVETYDVVIERNLPVPMRDGTVLLADHYFGRNNPSAPTILVRSPYGRANIFAYVFAQPFAERGFQVVIQSCRGTFGSGGEFNAFRNEQHDGFDTIEWMQQQPWFTGAFATLGPSYLGQVQWALAADAGGMLKALSMQITSSEFRSMVYPGESFGLDTVLTWIDAVAHQEAGLRQRILSWPRRTTQAKHAVAMHLPLVDADVLITGKPVPFYRDWLEHNAPDDPWWQAVDFSNTTSAIDAPVLLIAGWYDLFLPQMLADYARLRKAGKKPFLTIGPWAHTSAAVFRVTVQESLAWFQAHLLGKTDRLRAAPVRVYVMGRNRWIDLSDWPPPGYQPVRWFLQPEHGLATEPAGTSDPDQYRYDPSNPTPAVGGSSLSRNSGPKDNRAVEARPDVLVYTSAVLAHEVEVVGAVKAELYFTSSLEHTDVFVRLCDVDPKGRSINVSDGLIRLEPGRPHVNADDTWKITVELWATAHCFKRGHRIRVQVAGGSHPRYVRNLGSGEPLGTSTTLRAADHTVYHDPEHPSALVLSVKD